MQKTRFWLTTGLIACVFINALPIAAQNKPAAVSPGSIRLPVEASGPAEVYGKFRKTGQNAAFRPMLKKVAGTEANEIEAALEAQALSFFEEFASGAKVDVAQIHDKAKKLNQKNYEQLKKTPPQSKTGPKKLPRAIGKSFAGDDLFPMEFEGLQAPATPADGPRITTTQTETGTTSTGSDTRTMDMAGSTVTRTEEGVDIFNTDGKEITNGTTRTTKTEIISKTDGRKLNLTNKMSWESGFAICPEAQGRLSGHGRAVTSSQVVITIGNRIAAVTQEASVDYKFTGYVNDDAVFTHFIIEGEGRESITGYDRARDLDLLEEDKGLHDGTGTIKFRMDDCKPPYETEPDAYGIKRSVDPQMSEGIITMYQPVAGSDLLINYVPTGGTLIMLIIKDLMRVAIANIRNGECVDVECTAAKNTLEDGEVIDITTVSVSKKDLDKFDARLETTSNARPEKQPGTPSAVFAFTADAGGGGTFIVKSTSRRGIGLGMLQFGKEGENDLDKDKCDGNWHGTVEIIRTFEDTYKEVTKPGDQKSDLQLSGWKEVINRQKYEGTVRIEDLTLATQGAWVMNTMTDITHSSYYLDSGFFTTPNECGWNVKKTIKEENGVEKREEGGGTDASDITIQIYGDEYRVNTWIREAKGTHMRNTWHRPSGYCQEKNNKPFESNTSEATSFTKVQISFEGKIDPSNPDVLTGTRTVTRNDGKETITITWNIKRCAPVKTKPPVKKKK